ncbi:MAG: hypothetical protein ACWA6R_02785 [Nitrosomonas sp.]
MMSRDDSSERGLKSLSAQIHEAEMQVLACRRSVRLSAGTLLHKTQQHMIAPSNLLLAGGIGFIIGELMKLRSSPPAHASDSGGAEMPRISGMLMDALHMFNKVSSLYAAVRASSNADETRGDH